MRLLEAELGPYKLLLSAEIDGKASPGSSDYVEFKLSNRGLTSQHTRSWWLQSFLGGVPRIIMGHSQTVSPPTSKLREVLVDKLEEIEVEQLINRHKQETLLEGILNVLNMLHQSSLREGVVYRLERVPKTKTVRLVEAPESERFLSKAFLQEDFSQK